VAKVKAGKRQATRVWQRTIERAKVGLCRRGAGGIRVDLAYAPFGIDQQPERRFQIYPVIEQIAAEDGVGRDEVRVSLPEVQRVERDR
jgi:hypothetical protein